MNPSGTLARIVALALCVAAPALARAGGDTNEVWISARTNGLGSGVRRGTGAITAPYYGDFDAIINSLPTHTTIHLLPGVHYTKGFQGESVDAALKANQKVIGAGMDASIVRRDTRFHGDTTSQDGQLWSMADGVEISDLTVDANADGTEAFKKAAVFLGGNYCAVRRVKAINTSGNLARGSECFAIYIAPATNGIGNSISECEVSSVRGNYCDGISLIGQGEVKHNRVFLPVVTKHLDQAFYVAYSALGSRSAMIQGNYSYGGTAGFAGDTLSEKDLSIVNNTFQNVALGIYIVKASGYSIDGLFIRNNTIEISTNVDSSRDRLYPIYISNEDTTGKVVYRNVVIAGNTMRYCGNGGISRRYRTAILARGAAGTNFYNLRIVDNTIDRSFEFMLNARGVSLDANTDLQGVPLQFRQVGAGSASTVSLNPIDGMVIVTNPATTTIKLATATGYDGKRVTIVNSRSGGDLTVYPAAGQEIVLSTPALVSSNSSASFVSDGSSKWFKQ
jgi:hypothetical protein